MISKLSISKKLLLLTSTFLIILLIYNILLIKNSYDIYNSSIEVEKSANIISLENEIIHSLQVERGLSAGVLSGANPDAMYKQRNVVDKLVKDDKLQNAINDVRNKVDSKEKTAVVLKDYSSIIASQLLIVRNITDGFDSSYSDFSEALVLVGTTKERYGLLRGTLNGVFNANKMDIKTFSSISYMNTSIENKIKDLYELQIDFVTDFLKSMRTSSYQNYIKLAYENNINGQFNADAKDFFTVATNLIDDYKKLEDKITAKIIQQASDNKNLAKTSITIQILIAIFAQGLNLFLAYIISKNILKNLNLIEDGLESFFAFLEYKTDDVKPIITNNKDEFGKMADQINKTVNELKVNYAKDQKSIDEIMNVTNKIKSGNLDNTLINEPYNPRIIMLKSILQEMLDTLKAKIGLDINQIDNLVREYANMKFTNNISKPHGNIEKSLNILHNEIRNMLKVQENMSNVLKSNSQNLKNSMNLLSEGSKNAKNSLEESAAAINEMSSSMSAIYSKSSEIGQQSDAIKDVIHVIRSIADDTGLLALNAAIEAARAGEHGRGFAVVAEEVSKLAQNTNKSLGEIEANVKLLVQQIYDIGHSIDEQTKAMNLVSQSITYIDELSKNNDLIANDTSKAAEDVDSIASDIIKDLNEKEF